MYAGTKPIRAIAQPSNLEVQQLLQEHQKTKQHPPSQEALHALWHPEERTRLGILS